MWYGEQSLTHQRQRRGSDGEIHISGNLAADRYPSVRIRQESNFNMIEGGLVNKERGKWGTDSSFSDVDTY